MYYIIVNPNSKYVSFSKSKHDICFGDKVSGIIKEYTNAQYIAEFGSRIIEVPFNTAPINEAPKYDGVKKMTIAEYLDKNIFRHNKSNCTL